MRMSGRRLRATATVSSVERPSTRITSFTQDGMAGRTCLRLLASLMAQTTAETVGLPKVVRGRPAGDADAGAGQSHDGQEYVADSERGPGDDAAQRHQGADLLAHPFRGQVEVRDDGGDPGPRHDPPGRGGGVWGV